MGKHADSSTTMNLIHATKSLLESFEVVINRIGRKANRKLVKVEELKNDYAKANTRYTEQLLLAQETLQQMATILGIQSMVTYHDYSYQKVVDRLTVLRQQRDDLAQHIEEHGGKGMPLNPGNGVNDRADDWSTVYEIAAILGISTQDVDKQNLLDAILGSVESMRSTMKIMSDRMLNQQQQLEGVQKCTGSNTEGRVLVPLAEFLLNRAINTWLLSRLGTIFFLSNAGDDYRCAVHPFYGEEQNEIGYGKTREEAIKSLFCKKVVPDHSEDHPAHFWQELINTVLRPDNCKNSPQGEGSNNDGVKSPS